MTLTGGYPTSNLEHFEHATVSIPVDPVISLVYVSKDTLNCHIHFGTLDCLPVTQPRPRITKTPRHSAADRSDPTAQNKYRDLELDQLQ